MLSGAQACPAGAQACPAGRFQAYLFLLLVRHGAGSRWEQNLDAVGPLDLGGAFLHDADPAGSRGCSAAVAPFDRGRLIKVISFGLGEL